MTRGLFIVVEGMDNVGKTTFVDAFVKKYPLTHRIKLPTPEIYSLIKEVPSDMWHDIFHENIERTIKNIGYYVNNNSNVICDRYIYSHFVYEAMTSKKNCIFKNNLNPNAIVYFAHANAKSLPKKDIMEKQVDYAQGQKRFERLFKKLYIPCVTVPALQPTSIQIAFTFLEKLFGERLYRA